LAVSAKRAPGFRVARELEMGKRGRMQAIEPQQATVALKLLSESERNAAEKPINRRYWQLRSSPLRRRLCAIA
jgi:hypothetical protein